MMKQLLLLTLALALLAGCNLPLTPELPIATATSTPAPSATPTTLPPTPTPTPTPSPTPTPTPQPSELLSQADRAYALGDWETAESLYNRLMPLSSISQAEALNTMLGLGKTLLAEGRFDEGSALLAGIAADLPDTPQATNAHLALGDALLAAGDPAQAAVHYRAVLDAQPAFAPYAHEWLGDALVAAGDYTSALESYRAALALAETTSGQVFLWEKIALTHAALQSYDESLAAYDAILQIARVPAYRARIAYQAAETARLFGDEAEAMRRYHEIVDGYPTETYAYQALVQLVEAGEPVDELLRGEIDYRAGAYGPAVQAFYRVIQAEHTGEPHYYAGLSYLEAGSPQLALAEFETLLEAHPGDAYWGSAWIGKARALVDLGRNDEASAAYRALPDALPDHHRAAEALWSAAELLEQAERWEEAAAAFVELAERYPDDSGAPDARFHAGLDLYREGQPEAARRAWEELLRWYPHGDRAQAARFWLGKTYLQAGNVVSATAALSRTVAADPWSYYGLRAADLMEGHTPFTGPEEFLRPCGDEAEQQAVLDWMAGWLGVESPAALAIPPAELLADPRLERGLTLLRWGRFDEGRTDLEALREAYVQNAAAQYHLALIFREAGLYRSSIIAAATVWKLSPAGDITQVPRFLGCLVYPRYFADLVEKGALEFGFDSLVLYALLRQESLFEGFATSHAAAHGLMQVIPATGAEIAAALGWPPDYETRDLYRPLVSARFGTWYLAQQRDRFAGELFPALAGYNGGPGNAARWWEAAGEDRDLFVELIAFRETRTYVERITEHYARYYWLYAEETGEW